MTGRPATGTWPSSCCAAPVAPTGALTEPAGNVMVDVEVDPRGRVRTALMRAPTIAPIEQAARRSLAGFLFLPAADRGRARTDWLTVDVLVPPPGSPRRSAVFDRTGLEVLLDAAVWDRGRDEFNRRFAGMDSTPMLPNEPEAAEKWLRRSAAGRLEATYRFAGGGFVAELDSTGKVLGLRAERAGEPRP